MALNNYYSNGKAYYEFKYSESQYKSILQSDLSGIFGIPYQFLPSVDPRITDTKIGRKYGEKIVSKIPLLFLTPCRQVFMPEFSKEEKSTILELLLGEDYNGQGLTMETTGKYYTTYFAYDKYIKYVNTMCSQLSYFLDIQNTELKDFAGRDKVKIASIDWDNIRNESFDDYFSAHKAVVYYLDGLTTISENFSNNTTESSLASTINGYSDQVNEIKFLIGENSALSVLADGTANFGEKIAGALSDISAKLVGGMLSDLSEKGVSTVLEGGKIIFPKIWQNSGFDRSYTFDIKLRSPDHDSLSIFLNILVPYIHILALTLPISDTDNYNAYKSPFLVKAYCKGMFNIDMGMITNLSVTRGAECQWNDDGLPTQIDISITIEDLYSSLFMTNEESGNIFSIQSRIVKNTSMMDFLANLAGLNIAETEILRREKMYIKLLDDKFKRVPSNIYNTFDNAVANLISKIYR